jgi:hypothetical protein
MFEKTSVEISDRHTVLNHLGASPRLRIGARADFTKLCVDLDKGTKTPLPVAYQTLVGTKGSVVDNLRPGWRKEKFWYRTLATDNARLLAKKAWSRSGPIQAKPPRIDCTAGEPYKCKVTPLPRILIFPFGWSTTVSLRITGPHDLGTIASIVADVHSKPVFGRGGVAVTLRDLLNTFSDGVRDDVFLGPDTDDTGGQEDPFTVTTVLARGTHPGLSLGGLQRAEIDAIRRIVKPLGGLPEGPFSAEIRERGKTSGPQNFLVFGESGTFIWLAKLLKTTPEERYAAHLRCYHNNTHHALLIARHQVALVARLVAEKALDAERVELLRGAIDLLETPGYRCAALERFVAQPWVQEKIKQGHARPEVQTTV